jgi:hypothetical protein
MQVYWVTKDTNIHEFVHTGYYGLTGPPHVPETYHVSKELVAYLETLVAFSPYYRADDPRMSGKMEPFYQQALLRYKDYTYDEFHKYITKKLTAFYERFSAPEAEDKTDEKDATGDEGDVVEVGPLPDGAIVAKRHYAMSDSEEEEVVKQPAAAGAAAADPEAAAAAAAAAAGSGEAPAAAAAESAAA